MHRRTCWDIIQHIRGVLSSGFRYGTQPHRKYQEK